MAAVVAAAMGKGCALVFLSTVCLGFWEGARGATSSVGGGEVTPPPSPLQAPSPATCFNRVQESLLDGSASASFASASPVIGSGSMRRNDSFSLYAVPGRASSGALLLLGKPRRPPCGQFSSPTIHNIRN